MKKKVLFSLMGLLVLAITVFAKSSSVTFSTTMSDDDLATWYNDIVTAFEAEESLADDLSEILQAEDALTGRGTAFKNALKAKDPVKYASVSVKGVKTRLLAGGDIYEAAKAAYGIPTVISTELDCKVFLIWYKEIIASAYEWKHTDLAIVNAWANSLKGMSAAWVDGDKTKIDTWRTVVAAETCLADYEKKWPENVCQNLVAEGESAGANPCPAGKSLYYNKAKAAKDYYDASIYPFIEANNAIWTWNEIGAITADVFKQFADKKTDFDKVVKPADSASEDEINKYNAVSNKYNKYLIAGANAFSTAYEKVINQRPDMVNSAAKTAEFEGYLNTLKEWLPNDASFAEYDIASAVEMGKLCVAYGLANQMNNAHSAVGYDGTNETQVDAVLAFYTQIEALELSATNKATIDAFVASTKSAADAEKYAINQITYTAQFEDKYKAVINALNANGRKYNIYNVGSYDGTNIAFDGTDVTSIIWEKLADVKDYWTTKLDETTRKNLKGSGCDTVAIYEWCNRYDAMVAAKAWLEAKYVAPNPNAGKFVNIEALKNNTTDYVKLYAIQQSINGLTLEAKNNGTNVSVSELYKEAVNDVIKTMLGSYTDAARLLYMDNYRSGMVADLIERYGNWYKETKNESVVTKEALFTYGTKTIYLNPEHSAWRTEPDYANINGLNEAAKDDIRLTEIREAIANYKALTAKNADHTPDYATIENILKKLNNNQALAYDRSELQFDNDGIKDLGVKVAAALNTHKAYSYLLELIYWASIDEVAEEAFTALAAVEPVKTLKDKNSISLTEDLTVLKTNIADAITKIDEMGHEVGESAIFSNVEYWTWDPTLLVIERNEKAEDIKSGHTSVKNDLVNTSAPEGKIITKFEEKKSAFQQMEFARNWAETYAKAIAQGADANLSKVSMGDLYNGNKMAEAKEKYDLLSPTAQAYIEDQYKQFWKGYIVANGDKLPSGKKYFIVDGKQKIDKGAYTSDVSLKELLKTVETDKNQYIVVDESCDMAGMVLPANVVAKSTDPKIGWFATELNITDGMSYYFENDVKVGKVTLNKTFSDNGLYSFLTPINITADQLGQLEAKGYSFYYMNSASEQRVSNGIQLTVNWVSRKIADYDVETLESTIALSGNKPYVVKRNKDVVDPFVLKDVTITNTEETDNSARAVCYTTSSKITVVGEREGFGPVEARTGLNPYKGIDFNGAHIYKLGANNAWKAAYDWKTAVPTLGATPTEAEIAEYNRIVKNKKVTLGATKVYIFVQVDDTNANYIMVNSFDGEESEATGIESVATDASSSKAASIYTAGGVKVSDMSAPGLYIVNGKKVLVK